MPRHRRIAVFASFSGLGGVERMLVNLIQGFVEQGRGVDLLLVRAASPHLDQLPAGVRRVDLGTPHTLLAPFALARWLRRERPPVLLAAKDRAGRAAVLARALARVDTRLVLRLGTNLSAAQAESTRFARWLRQAPIRLLYPKIEQIIAVSDGVRDDTAAIARVPRERIAVIRNPVITPALIALASAPCTHPWLQSHDGHRIPVIVAAGRLQRQKDFPTLIRAFAALLRERPCRLLILGDGRGRRRLEALCDRLGLRRGRNGDIDLPGFQPNLYSWLVRADLFVLSSAWEGSPNVLTEALALGIPAVSTDCPSGPRELLDNGRFGPLVAVADSSGLAKAMRKTLDHPLPPEILKQAAAEYTQAASARAYLRALDAL